MSVSSLVFSICAGDHEYDKMWQSNCHTFTIFYHITPVLKLHIQYKIISITYRTLQSGKSSNLQVLHGLLNLQSNHANHLSDIVTLKRSPSFWSQISSQIFNSSCSFTLEYSIPVMLALGLDLSLRTFWKSLALWVQFLPLSLLITRTHNWPYNRESAHDACYCCWELYLVSMTMIFNWKSRKTAIRTRYHTFSV